MRPMRAVAFYLGLGLSLLLLSGCPKKEEERIIITIQTEDVEEVQPAASPPASQPQGTSPAADKERKPEGPPPVVAKAPPRPLPVSPAPPAAIPEKPESASEPPQAPPVKKFSEEVVSPAPAALPQQPLENPSQEAVSPAPVGLPQRPLVQPSDQPAQDEDQIIAIVQRQEEAFEKKDVDLYTADLGTVTPKTEKEFKRIVDQLDTIDVRFEIEEITVKKNSAQVILRQTTHLVPKRGGKPQSTKAKILWGLTKVGGDWKIEETKILEKY